MPASMPEKPWIWQCETVIPSHAAAARASAGSTDRRSWLETAGLAARFSGFGLAVEEALVNAIKHGNRQDPTKRIHVGFCLSAIGCGSRSSTKVEVSTRRRCPIAPTPNISTSHAEEG